MRRDDINLVPSERDLDNLLMVRGDKTMLELMREKPSGRWDPEYWAPDFEELLAEMAARFETRALGDFIAEITYGQVGRRVYNPSGTVRYIQTINLTNTGIDYKAKEARIDEESHNDLERSRLRSGDLLLGNAGMGGLGKCVVFLDDNERVNISQDIDLIRFEGLNTCYAAVFLKSIYGKTQIWRRSRGVGAPKLPFEEIRAIQIPVVPVGVQEHVEAGYMKIFSFHKKAMEAKETADEAGCVENMRIAERMLKDLIAKTEEVIRGERDDVI